MSRRRRKADDLTNLAANLGREDGGDPREFHAKPWNKQKQASHKGQQLCTQVHEALHGVFAACADSVLQQLGVVSVEPAPHTGRMLVIVSAPADIGWEAAEAALGASGSDSCGRKWRRR